MSISPGPPPMTAGDGTGTLCPCRGPGGSGPAYTDHVQTWIFEATQADVLMTESGPANWGKFLVARMDSEWARISVVSPGPVRSLLAHCGWDYRFLWVMDLQTGEGALFRPGGSARADLEKHKIWVCPLFGPFLEWLYAQDLSDMDRLPQRVELPDAPFAVWGHRRPGPAAASA